MIIWRGPAHKWRSVELIGGGGQKREPRTLLISALKSNEQAWIEIWFGGGDLTLEWLLCEAGWFGATQRNSRMRGWPRGWASAFQADLDGFDSRTPLFHFVGWWTLQDSNLRPSACEADALTN